MRVKKQKLRLILSNDDITVLEFKPSLFHLVANNNILKLKFSTKILFSIKYLFGYKIYYAYKENIPIYYCIISFGYFFKHPYVKKHEILVGPYFTKEENRGYRIAEKALQIILSELDYRKAYVFANKRNMASQKVVLKNGFNQIGYGDYKGPLSIFKLSKDGDGYNFIVYTKNNE